jgi:hypothetical protein
MSRSLLNAGARRLGRRSPRHLLLAVHGRAIEGADEGSESTMIAQPAEAPRGLSQASSDPADGHAAVPLAAAVAYEVTEEVEVRERVRAAERAVERAGDPKPLEAERLVQSLAQRGGRTRVGVIERGPEPQDAALGKGGVGEPVCLIEDGGPGAASSFGNP